MCLGNLRRIRGTQFIRHETKTIHRDVPPNLTRQLTINSSKRCEHIDYFRYNSKWVQNIADSPRVPWEGQMPSQSLARCCFSSHPHLHEHWPWCSPIQPMRSKWSLHRIIERHDCVRHVKHEIGNTICPKQCIEEHEIEYTLLFKCSTSNFNHRPRHVQPPLQLYPRTHHRCRGNDVLA